MPKPVCGISEALGWRERMEDAHEAGEHLGGEIFAGAAAATFYLAGDRFLAANAGDVRVVIGTAAGALSLTVDHKPGLAEERARIEALGGRVLFYDVPWVQGVLAMSWALGDASLKPFVTPEPRVVEGLLGRENDCLVLACDGVWDVIGPGEAVALARVSPHPQEAADRLVCEALACLSTDNLTVIVLDLRSVTAELAREKMRVLSVLDRAVGRHA